MESEEMRVERRLKLSPLGSVVVISICPFESFKVSMLLNNVVVCSIYSIVFHMGSSGARGLNIKKRFFFCVINKNQ